MSSQTSSVFSNARNAVSNFISPRSMGGNRFAAAAARNNSAATPRTDQASETRRPDGSRVSSPNRGEVCGTEADNLQNTQLTVRTSLVTRPATPGEQPITDPPRPNSPRPRATAPFNTVSSPPKQEEAVIGRSSPVDAMLGRSSPPKQEEVVTGEKPGRAESPITPITRNDPSKKEEEQTAIDAIIAAAEPVSYLMPKRQNTSSPSELVAERDTAQIVFITPERSPANAPMAVSPASVEVMSYGKAGISNDADDVTTIAHQSPVQPPAQPPAFIVGDAQTRPALNNATSMQFSAIKQQLGDVSVSAKKQVVPAQAVLTSQFSPGLQSVKNGSTNTLPAPVQFSAQSIKPPPAPVQFSAQSIKPPPAAQIFVEKPMSDPQAVPFNFTLSASSTQGRSSPKHSFIPQIQPNAPTQLFVEKPMAAPQFQQYNFTVSAPSTQGRSSPKHSFIPQPVPGVAGSTPGVSGAFQSIRAPSGLGVPGVSSFSAPPFMGNSTLSLPSPLRGKPIGSLLDVAGPNMPASNLFPVRQGQVVGVPLAVANHKIEAIHKEDDETRYGEYKFTFNISELGEKIDLYVICPRDLDEGGIDKIKEAGKKSLANLAPATLKSGKRKIGEYDVNLAINIRGLTLISTNEVLLAAIAKIV